MKISAVIVTYNRINLLKRTVDCLRANGPVNEIVVVKTEAQTALQNGWILRRIFM